jgi:hypothetical protein
MRTVATNIIDAKMNSQGSLLYVLKREKDCKEQILEEYILPLVTKNRKSALPSSWDEI